MRVARPRAAPRAAPSKAPVTKRKPVAKKAPETRMEAAAKKAPVALAPPPAFPFPGSAQKSIYDEGARTKTRVDEDLHGRKERQVWSATLQQWVSANRPPELF